MTRTITTDAELDALPIDSIVLDLATDVWQRDATGWVLLAAPDCGLSARNYLPATVIHVPGQTAPTVKPNRDDAIEAVSAALHVTTDRIPGLNPGPVLTADGASVEVAVDAILALLPGRTEAEIKAEALREAAAELVRAPLVEYHQPTVWLHARAAGIEFADEVQRGERDA